ncbi:hypothetical protein HAX54_042214 [Datura stramonium]|uniref:Uncharacterized protein n=1 Tax=Datura stramonium TaxID=4076 RepID=A0ABS8SLZ0_DATST|nr:hypothetical protein [Datura stramonium]
MEVPLCAYDIDTTLVKESSTLAPPGSTTYDLTPLGSEASSTTPYPSSNTPHPSLLVELNHIKVDEKKLQEREIDHIGCPDHAQTMKILTRVSIVSLLEGTLITETQERHQGRRMRRLVRKEGTSSTSPVIVQSPAMDSSTTETPTTASKATSQTIEAHAP